MNISKTRRNDRQETKKSVKSAKMQKYVNFFSSFTWVLKYLP